ncbi:hypothetical protein RclHR1_04400004 [Rhizophagus clarus]|uniref:C2H2-type domain-containing protein n=1 Tax=Rhizophagus clarus TaxID=94130 RepID=A0A2Z6RIS8_9GLOM|nr:hypothetical protein RclHR1_04400004 [Rhizophagus clarus]
MSKHLRRHAQQKPFKCPICNLSRFGSPGALSQHLINVHNGNVDTDDDYDTLSDENEELNLVPGESNGGENTAS